jgi:CheY-like chemotaxis protein
MSDQDSKEGEGSLGALCVARLLDRHRVPERERARLVAQALGLSYHAGLRRVSGSSPWTLEDLETVGAAYGESLLDVILGANLEGCEESSFTIGSLQERCQVWVGEAVGGSTPSSIVAVRAGSEWVIRTAAAIGHEAAHFVRRIAFSPMRAERLRRIAVVDDSSDIAESICAYLRAVGFEANAYFSFESIGEKIASREFDAYIVDWVIDGTASRLLASIRAVDQTCPIVVLTGKARSNTTDISELGSALAVYKALFFEKPAQPSLMVAKISESLREIKINSAQGNPHPKVNG